jgi:glutamate 5-kinase
MSAAAPGDRSYFTSVRRVVVKIGSRLLADDLHGRVSMLAAEVKQLKERGVEVTIVTSGAIALGVKRLGLQTRPRDIPGLQAAAAVGQGHLIHAYEHTFSGFGLAAAQVLLTHDDVRDRRRYLNARLALTQILALGAVPVINENDTVSVDEIKFGDNDQLSALVTSLVHAEALVILTDVDGLYDGDPRAADSHAKLIHEVHDVAKQATPVAGGSSSGVGTGGMRSKVFAATVAGDFGVPTIITNGRGANPITLALAGQEVGTAFWPDGAPLQGRKHWIAHALKPTGTLVVDDGAKRALTDGKKSLLPSGVRRVEGRFEAGDMVSIVTEAGGEFARGLVAYDAGEVAQIAGRRSSEIEGILGYRSLEEVVHRDDLVLL